MLAATLVSFSICGGFYSSLPLNWRGRSASLGGACVQRSLDVECLYLHCGDRLFLVRNLDLQSTARRSMIDFFFCEELDVRRWLRYFDSRSVLHKSAALCTSELLWHTAFLSQLLWTCEIWKDMKLVHCIGKVNIDC